MKISPSVHGRGTFFWLKIYKSRGILCLKDKGYRILLGANSKDNLFPFNE